MKKKKKKAKKEKPKNKYRTKRSKKEKKRSLKGFFSKILPLATAQKKINKKLKMNYAILHSQSRTCQST